MKEDPCSLFSVVEATRHLGDSLWYLATPYSRYPTGFDAACGDASKVAAHLLKQGVAVFAPVVHGHPIAHHGDMDKLDRGLWLSLDRHMMKACAGVIVAKMDGWGSSYGVAEEIKYFDEADKPVIMLDVGDLLATPQHDTIVMKHTGFPSSPTSPDEWRKVYTVPPIGERKSYPATPPPSPAKARKDYPMASGVLDYFPDALAAVSAVSKIGNGKHNPGQPMHHARGKAGDHADSLLRHLKDRGTVDSEDGVSHTGKVAWRALALLQEEIEQDRIAAGEDPSAVLPRGARAAQ